MSLYKSIILFLLCIAFCQNGWCSESEANDVTSLSTMPSTETPSTEAVIDPALKVHFFGVRGSFQRAEAAYSKYGGYTSCVAVESDGQLFIFDAGSGMISASDLGCRQPTNHTHLFFSHTHADHIAGLMAYEPFFKTGHTIDIYAGHMANAGGIEQDVRAVFSPPRFPVPYDTLPAHVICHDIAVGSIQTFGNVTISSHALNHPGGATGYRLRIGDGDQAKSICYITDHESVPSYDRNGLVDFVRGADLLIHDSTYSDENYETYKGRGHSTWQETIRLGQEAGVKKAVIFHHDPKNTDDLMQEIEQQVKAMAPNAIVARQGMVVAINTTY